MISLNMPKASMNDQVETWLAAGNTIKQMSGFENKLHKPITMPKPKTRLKQEPLARLSEQQADKLNAWLLVQDGRLTKLANYLGTTSQTVRRISNRMAPCPPSKWRNIVKFMESYK